MADYYCEKEGYDSWEYDEQERVYIFKYESLYEYEDEEYFKISPEELGKIVDIMSFAEDYCNQEMFERCQFDGKKFLFFREESGIFSEKFAEVTIEELLYWALYHDY